METLFKYFELNDDIVYMSDPETYELVYMNKVLRMSLDIKDDDDYAGQKCYKVLQGKDAPCEFCTNHKLKSGEIFSWKHSNPILNRSFLIKDSLLEHEGKNYRIEIAIALDKKEEIQPHFRTSEKIINDCINEVVSTIEPEAAIDKIIEYIGKTFNCDRVYIFETKEKITNNTYEWCRNDVLPQKYFLQNIPLSELQWWMDAFEKDENIIIDNVENIKLTYPNTYATLKPQNIHSLVATAMVVNERIIGFLGVDNPQETSLEVLGSILHMIAFLVITLLKRRDLLTRLNYMSYVDSLTGAYNNNAFYTDVQKFEEKNTIGLIYCDITGLKMINDTMGHSEGDKAIVKCCDIIRKTIGTDNLYRIGGDEFIAVIEDMDKEDFLKKAERLRTIARLEDVHIAVGHSWTDEKPMIFENLIENADMLMYEDKRQYYENLYRTKGIIYHDNRISRENQVTSDSAFFNFIENSYHDEAFLFRAISLHNDTTYFYFGDMQKNIFYLSDNMKNEFGFKSNVVPDLLSEWAKLIHSKKYIDMYWQDLDDILKEKRDVHDLRYQIYDADGNVLWIRCFGLVKWDEERTKPLFFAGRVTKQDNNFVVDHISNFPSEVSLLKFLDEVRISGKSVQVIGFSLNNIAEINTSKGRGYSDHLIRSIAENLNEELSESMTFYRIEGVRFVAVIDEKYIEKTDELIDRMKRIIARGYEIMGISIMRPSSFAVVNFPDDDISTADFTNHMVSLIRMAKQDMESLYVEFSEESIKKIEDMSKLSLRLVRDILNNMENFRIVVQPLISGKNGKIIGGEVLLRWKYEGNDVSPGVFIPIIENEKMMDRVGAWVFEQTLITGVKVSAYFPEFFLSCNVNMSQIVDDRFMNFVDEKLKQYNADGSRFVFEITEHSMDEHPDKLLKFIRHCRNLNTRIALDDFGSGYSSIRMLLQYPFDIIKLDKSLIQEESDSEVKKNFISSIVYACNRANKNVCIEGIETAEHLKLAHEAGCDIIQGFYYHRPMEIDSIHKIIIDQESQE